MQIFWSFLQINLYISKKIITFAAVLGAKAQRAHVYMPEIKNKNIMKKV